MDRIPDISTHAPRTGSDYTLQPDTPSHKISTHAPRTGSDAPGRRERPKTATFQPTLPARGATCLSTKCSRPDSLFQPTLPARGATKRQENDTPDGRISTHAPRTGSDVNHDHRQLVLHGISTHALHDLDVIMTYFNPRSPHGERRQPTRTAASGRPISTHAPRTGSDLENSSDKGS